VCSSNPGSLRSWKVTRPLPNNFFLVDLPGLLWHCGGADSPLCSTSTAAREARC
jgi:hypothetical protein